MGPPAPLARWDPKRGVAKKQRPLASIVPTWQPLHTGRGMRDTLLGIVPTQRDTLPSTVRRPSWHGSCMPSKYRANVAMARTLLLARSMPTWQSA